MKISFCIICYNEESLIKQQLINLYKHAHEIIIVEGRTLEFGDKFPKQRDQTLKIIKDFPDSDNKITLISQETWPGKNDMVAAYYKAATGDYVWHIDADEFYTDECIEGTKKYIEAHPALNYAHHEYYYYRYYNIVIAKKGRVKFWNKPARIHKKTTKHKLIHRPQLLEGTGKNLKVIPQEVGIRHHHSIMDLDRVKIKAHFYGLSLHGKYFNTYEKPIEELIKKQTCVRPDNNQKEDSIPAVLDHDELQVPRGVDKLFERYTHDTYPQTIEDDMQLTDLWTRGVIYPIPPAFDDNDELDVKSIERYLSHLSAHGAKIILVTAGTARFNLMTDQEIEKFNEVCMSFDGIKILGLPPRHNKGLTRHINLINSLEPDAVLAMYPDRYYSDDNIYDFFYDVAVRSDVPVMIHGMFMRHATAGGTYNFTPELVRRLKEINGIVGMKEESTTFELAYKVSREADDGFIIFPAGGSCRRYLLTHPAGAQNFLGGIGNIYPEIEEAFYAAMKDGDQRTAHMIVERYEDPLFKTFAPIGWHRALQVALELKKLLRTTNRPPFAKAHHHHKDAVGKVLTLIEERLETEGLQWK